MSRCGLGSIGDVRSDVGMEDESRFRRDHQARRDVKPIFLTGSSLPADPYQGPDGFSRPQAGRGIGTL